MVHIFPNCTQLLQLLSNVAFLHAGPAVPSMAFLMVKEDPLLTFSPTEKLV